MTATPVQPTLSWRTLQSEVRDFSQRLIAALNELDIHEQCEDLEIDHVCVRLNADAKVDALKVELLQAGQCISSAVVNGREIMLFQLHEPLELGPWQTYGVELPYPKPNHAYVNGWEHVEFVLADAPNTMDDVRKAFFQKFNTLDNTVLKTEYSYSEDEPHAEKDQLPNPTIGLKVNGVGLKFHALPIQKVVGLV